MSCKKTIQEKKLLSKSDVAEIHDFVTKLNIAFNEYDYDFVLNSWSHTIFRKRIKNLNSTERGVLDYIYNSKLIKQIDNNNIDIINEIRHSNGKITHLKTNIKDNNHAEITYLMELETRFFFLKYRLEILNSEIKLSDIYFFKEDEWMSHRIKKMLKLNTEYKSNSINRYNANKSLSNYNKALSKGDKLEAFKQLNNIPKSHKISNDIRISRIHLASQLSDSIFNMVITKEKEINNNIYIEYLINLYTIDSIQNTEISDTISKEIGIKKYLLDSLHNKGIYWD